MKDTYINGNGLKQTIAPVAGRILYMDCMDTTPADLAAGLEVLEDSNLDGDGRRIALISSLKGSGDEIIEAGKELVKYEKIDKFIFLAGDDEPVYEGAVSVLPKEKIERYRNEDGAAEALVAESKIGDAILVCGTYESGLYRVPDIAFGTSYAAVLCEGKGVKIPAAWVKAEYIEDMQGIDAKGPVVRNAICVTLPDALEGHKLLRVADKAYLNMYMYKMVFLSRFIRTIGKQAFSGCVYLDKIYLPRSVKYLDEKAFEGCKRLAYAGMTDVMHIAAGAFKDCGRLRKVVLSEDCGFISETAFEGCPDVTIFAPENSYAAAYAKEHGIKFEVTDGDREKENITEQGTPKSVECTNPTEPGAPDDSEDKLNVVVCGDVMTHDSQLIVAYDIETGRYSFDKYFVSIASELGAADLKICNVETTFGPGIKRGYPRFNTPNELAEVIGKAGFDIGSCANNHTYDTYADGVTGTIDTLEANGVAVTGIKRAPEDKGYCIVEKKGLKIAVLNYTYRSEANGGVPTLNMTRVDPETFRRINSFCWETLDEDLNHIESDVKSARADGADIVFVYYHWGNEYDLQAREIQKFIAQKTAEMGVDAIIGSHPHVLQEMEILKVNGRDIPVYYSLGNYIWGQLSPLGRDQSNNSCLAKLQFDIDTKTKTVKGVKAEYVPLFIPIEQQNHDFEFGVYNLKEMDEAQRTEFGYKNTYTVDETIEQIDNILQYSDGAVRCFDDVIEIEVGKKTDLKQNKIFTSGTQGKEIVKYTCENCVAASILQTGEVIGNAPGYAGITVYGSNGEKFMFMMRVVDRGAERVPVLIDAYNRISDTYRLYENVRGDRYRMPNNCKVTPETGAAWRKMVVDASKAGITLKCTVNGFITTWPQTYRAIWFAEKYGEELTRKRYMLPGHSEHHLGESLDAFASKDPDEKYIKWLEENAYKYGFIIRMPMDGYTPRYVHIRYYGQEIAKIMHDENLSLEQYLIREVPLAGAKKKFSFFRKK